MLSRRFAALLPLATTLFFANPAAAQGLESFQNLTQTVITVLQAIGLTAAAGGFIFAGLKFNSGAPDAKDSAKNALIGSSLIAGAVVLVQFVRGFF